MNILSIFTNPYLWASTIAMAVPLALPAIGGTFLNELVLLIFLWKG